MADEQCIHDLSPLSCAVCSPPARASVAAFVIYDYGPWVEAGFPGAVLIAGRLSLPAIRSVRTGRVAGCAGCAGNTGEFSRSDWDGAESVSDVRHCAGCKGYSRTG